MPSHPDLPVRPIWCGWISLRTNSQAVFPRGSVTLVNLKWLVLASNRLSGGIPRELGNLASLELLVLDENQLSGSIPPELGNLTNLEMLMLGENGLSGPVPSSFMQLSLLTRLRLSETRSVCRNLHIDRVVAKNRKT